MSEYNPKLQRKAPGCDQFIMAGQKTFNQNTTPRYHPVLDEAFSQLDLENDKEFWLLEAKKSV